MKKIWLYWENKNNAKKPEYLNLCLRTIRRKCGPGVDVILLDEKTVFEYLPNLRKEIALFPCIAHKADYIRAQLIYNHGGFWLDSDMILIQPIERIIRDLDVSGTDFVGCGRTGKRPSLGFMGGRKGCKLIGSWIEGMDKLISSGDNYKYTWTQLGYDILWKMSPSYTYHHYPFNICIPYFSNWKQIFFCVDDAEKAKYRERINQDTLMIALFNSMFPQSFKNMSETEVLNSKFLISDFLRENI